MNHDHPHPNATGTVRTLIIAIVLTLAFAGFEALAGWWSGSLALLGDAGHMVSDSVALIIAAAAARIALLPPSPRQ
ncbi:MAG TPA: cation transporter, partial [Burkholderiales bacterium]|nr:cation transporter [Burkholderiales bacterium]